MEDLLTDVMTSCRCCKEEHQGHRDQGLRSAAGVGGKGGVRRDRAAPAVRSPLRPPSRPGCAAHHAGQWPGGDVLAASLIKDVGDIPLNCSITIPQNYQASDAKDSEHCFRPTLGSGAERAVQHGAAGRQPGRLRVGQRARRCGGPGRDGPQQVQPQLSHPAVAKYAVRSCHSWEQA